MLPPKLPQQPPQPEGTRYNARVSDDGQYILLDAQCGGAFATIAFPIGAKETIKNLIDEAAKQAPRVVVSKGMPKNGS